MRETLYLMRHGQTQWNQEKRIQGQSDSPLLPQGETQALLYAKRLAHLRAQRIICSPSGRAAHTAQLVSGGRLPIQTDARLMEIALGAWEGHTWQEVFARWPKEADLYRNDPTNYAPHPGAESIADVRARVRGFLNDERVWQAPTLVVTHGVTLRCICAELKGAMDVWSLPFMLSCCHCEVNRTNGALSVGLFNETRHLEDGYGLWWHGSPVRLTTLRAGSTVTPIRPLAEAFSHKPGRLCLSDDGAIEQDGASPGYLYLVDVPDALLLTPHPASTMPDGYEFLTGCDLPLRLVAETPMRACWPARAPAGDPAGNPLYQTP